MERSGWYIAGVDRNEQREKKGDRGSEGEKESYANGIASRLTVGANTQPSSEG